MSKNWFTDAFKATLDDIHARVIDESFYNRRAGASAQHHHTHDHQHTHDQNAAERDIHGNEHGIDR